MGLAAVLALSGCSSAQYGYDDVYDHEYLVSVQPAAAVEKAPETTRQGKDYGKYDAYDEEGYTTYNRRPYSGSYSSRISRFYGPSLSISYFSGCHSPSLYGYGGYSSYYGYNPFYTPYYGYTSYYHDPYYWHIQHYHGYNNWYNPYGPYCNNYGYNSYYGYNPYYGHNPYYPNYGYDYTPNNTPTHYGPRPNYSGFSQSAQPSNSGGQGTGGLQEVEFDNGIKLNTIRKNTEDASPATPQQNETPVVEPKPRYTQPRTNSQPRINTVPRTTTQPRTIQQPQSQPRTVPSSPSQSQPKTKPSNTGGVRVKTISKD